jgi:hypothetical protein
MVFKNIDMSTLMTNNWCGAISFHIPVREYGLPDMNEKAAYRHGKPLFFVQNIKN